MRCVRCGNTADIEKHHIVHRAEGGTDAPWNLEDLCNACHDYQHAKEQLLDNIIKYAGSLKRERNKRRFGYMFRQLGKQVIRLRVLNQENTPNKIYRRGYYSYWNDKSTH